MPRINEIELAKVLGREPKAVRMAAKSGRITRGEDNLFDEAEAVAEWRATTHHEKGHNNRQPTDIPTPDIPRATEAKSTDYAKARAGTQIYEALLKKLRYEERAKNLTPTADVENARFTEFRILREACANIPARIAAVIAGESNVERIQQVLEAEITSVFAAFADGKLSC